MNLLDEKDALILATARSTRQLASTAAASTGLSRVAVSRRIKRLADTGYLHRVGSGTRQTYTPGQNQFWKLTAPREAVARAGGEFGMWEAHLSPLMAEVTPNVANIANIGFTEMLNNALDHSDAQALCMAVHIYNGRLQMAVMDDGMGIFRKIAEALVLFDDRLAMLELAKGKFTTAASGHSGMGVFVASRMLDGFAITSRGLTFDPRPAAERLAAFDWVDTSPYANGTVVRMDMALDSKRTAQAVYLRYFSPDESGGDAFHTTEVPVRLAQLSSQLTSRSQGKWVVERATQFKTVVLDFEGVEMVGQAFVDEVFRVFAFAHPEVQLKAIHLKPAVARMLQLFAPHFTP
ncbi:MAG: STAS-like domain-containing protein [Polaromonas sp.]